MIMNCNIEDILEILFLSTNKQKTIEDILFKIKYDYDAKNVFLFQPSMQGEFVHSMINTKNKLENTMNIYNDDIHVILSNYNDTELFIKQEHSYGVISKYLKDLNINTCRLIFLSNNYCDGFIVIIDETKYLNKYTYSKIAIYILEILLQEQQTIMLKRKISTLMQNQSTDKILLETTHKLLCTTDLEQSIMHLLEVLSNYYDAKRVIVFEYLDTNKHASISYEYFIQNLNPVKNNYRAIQIEDEYWQDILIHYKGIYYHNENNNPLMIMPFYQGQMKGFIVLLDASKNNKDQSFIKTIVLYILQAFNKRDILNKLNHLSYVDDVTGLYNRNRYFDYLEKIKRVPVISMGVVFIDINNLKLINDTLGHIYGDKLIIWCASILKDIFGNQVYRIGGDEFVCLLENYSKSQFDDIIRQFNNCLNTFKYNYLSIGYVYSQSFKNMDVLIHQADEYMYQNKVLNKQNYNISKVKLARLLKKQMKDINIKGFLNK